MVGAGLAGLVVAAALADAGYAVEVLERDPAPDGTVPRRGVPQDAQLHNLLGRAQLHLDELLPGFVDELRSAGCGDASVADGTYVYEIGEVMPRRPLGLRLLCAPRPVIDDVARRILLARTDATVRYSCRVIGLTGSATAGVAGVVVHGDDAAGVTLDADLVVDASGASTPATAWLPAIGVDLPPESAVRTDQWYASMVVERGAAADVADFVMIFPCATSSRGALLSRFGPTIWYLSINGVGTDAAPHDEASVRAFLADLPDPSLADVLATATFRSSPRVFRKVVARWRRFDQHPTIPGYVALGDALAALNPLYGQGMSVAAWQASLFREGLLLPGLDRVALAAELTRRMAVPVAAAWNLPAAIDRQLLGDLPLDAATIARRHAEWAARLRDDPDLHRTYVRAWHLLDAPAAIGAVVGSHDAEQRQGGQW